MSALASRPGLASAATGLAIILDAALACVMLRADEARVYVLGHPITWVCGLRSRLGLPCPTCGMTRSVVLTLHGEVERAWRVAPVGPVALFGMLAVAGALLALGCSQLLGARRLEVSAKSWIRNGAFIYGGAAILVCIGGWAVSLSAALHPG
jgi:hypothetical protein